MAARRRGKGRGQDGPLTLDIYARISRSTDGTRGRHVAGQVEDCRAEVEDRGAQVGEVWRDESLSAWNPKVVRPQWEALMERLESGACDGVVVYDLSRFTRKIMEGERLVTLADKGVVVWSLYGEYDLTTADGKRHFREDMVTFAGESDKISERTTRGKRKKALRGRSNASHRGFASPGYLPNPEGWLPGDPRTEVPADQLAAEVEAVREVAARVLRGETWASTVRWINGTGVRTPYGNAWTPETLRNTLRRPALAGIATHDGEEVGTLPGEPALDRETWDRVQSALAARKPGRQPSSQYLLTGALLCGRCGGRLTGRPQTARSPYPVAEDPRPIWATADLNADRTARSYWCLKRSAMAGEKTGCGRITIDQRWADEVVTDATLERLSNPRQIHRLAERAAQVAARRADLGEEIDRLERDAEALAGKTATWGLARVEAAMEPIDARLAVLRSERDALAAPEAPAMAAADVRARWDAGTVETRRAMVRQAFPLGVAIGPAASRGRGARYDLERFRWEPRQPR